MFISQLGSSRTYQQHCSTGRTDIFEAKQHWWPGCRVWGYTNSPTHFQVTECSLVKRTRAKGGVCWDKKKKPRCVLSSAKVFKWIGDRTSPQSTQDSYSLDAFYLSESKNPWLPVLITLLNQSEWIVTTCFRVMRIPSSTCQKRGHLMSVTWLNCKYKSEGPEVTFTCNLSSESTLTKENHHRVPGHVKNPPDHRSWRNHEKKEQSISVEWSRTKKKKVIVPMTLMKNFNCRVWQGLSTSSKCLQYHTVEGGALETCLVDNGRDVRW